MEWESVGLVSLPIDIVTAVSTQTWLCYTMQS